MPAVHMPASAPGGGAAAACLPLGRGPALLLALVLASILAPGCAATAGGGGPGSVAAPAVDGAALRIITFNIRYGTAPDGADAWPRRRELALRVLRDFDGAVVGLQEALRFQLDEITRALPHYGEVGVGRDDGARGGEYAAILHDRRRLGVLDHGWFWLSDTPEVPGSMTWGNRFPRIVTWVRLADRVTGATFYVYNTHWDHESAPARMRSASLLRERIATRAARADPVLVIGDFNAGDDDPAVKGLIAPPDDGAGAPGLADTFRAVHPAAQGVGTYHAFRGDRGGAKIDAVFASPEWRVLDAGIVHLADGGRYPSDHFPVTATLELRR